MSEWCEKIERAAYAPVRALCAYPIRHYKTTTTIHGLLYLLLKDPSRRITLLSHSHERAETLGKQLRDVCARVDNIGPTRGWNKITEWRNDRDGGAITMSADQSRVGSDTHVLMFDDPIDEKGAQDPKKRQTVDDAISFYTARCMRYGQPGPVLGVASRFDPEDPIGRRLGRTAVEWEYVHKPAIVDLGLETERALAPDVWDLPALRQMREELREVDPFERVFWSQLQGEPRPAGITLFGDPSFYTKLPDWNFRRGYGIDMMFVVGDENDWFARIVGRVYGTKLYILDATRHKIDPHLIESTCKADVNKFGRAPFFSYMSGPEVGMARVLQERGVPIHVMRARYNKLVRAQRTIKRWNDGDILIPEESAAPWVRGFLARLGNFRGRELDTNDDEIDALVSLCDGLMGGAVAGNGPKVLGKAYSGV